MTTKDKDGYIFIDRSPEKFRVVLEYLRTGLIEIPESLSKEAMVVEGEFYCLSAFVESLKEAIIAKPVYVGEPFFNDLMMDGCYVNRENSACYAFQTDGKFLRVDGLHGRDAPNATSQLLAILAAASFPQGQLSPPNQSWADRTRTLAQTGTYKQTGHSLILTWASRPEHDNFTPAILTSSKKLLVSRQSQPGVITYEFRSWEDC